MALSIQRQLAVGSCSRPAAVCPLRIPLKGSSRATTHMQAVSGVKVTATSDPEDNPLPKFTGQTYLRGEGIYDEVADQYATLNHADDGTMRPAAIIEAAGDEDVRTALAWARQNNLAVAVRTGGHQYSGASSTSGLNLQLDLSRTYKDITWLDDRNLEVGISRKLSKLNKELAARDAFVPHGQCAHVHVGGHAHSGGYGLPGRAFGLFGDHITAIRVITADGPDGGASEARWIERGTADPQEAQLFWAVLGGSPGNFAVLTHIRLKVHRGADHPKARGIQLFGLYNSKTLERLLHLKAEMAKDAELPADFDFCITVMSGRGAVNNTTIEPDPRSSAAAAVNGDDSDDDEGEMSVLEKYGVMTRHELEEYLTTGEGIEALQRLKEGLLPDDDDRPEGVKARLLQDVLSFRPIITVFAEWANLEGPKQSDAAALAWFDRIRDTGLWLPTPGLKGWGPESKEKGMPFMTSKWVFPIKREYNMPYEKRTYATNATNLDSSGWVDFTKRQIREIILKHRKGCRVAVQIQHYGGVHSRFRTQANDQSSYSWRDSSVLLTMDAFYRHDRARQIAMEWQAVNDTFYKGPAGNFSRNQDRRVFWGTYKTEGTEEDDLCKSWHYYHEDAAKWDMLVSIKARVDPDNVLSPNPFSVRA